MAGNAVAKGLRVLKVGRAVRGLKAIRGIKGHRVRKEIKEHRVPKETKANRGIKVIKVIRELLDFKVKAGRRAFLSTGSTAAEAIYQLRSAPGTQSLSLIRIPIQLLE